MTPLRNRLRAAGWLALLAVGTVFCGGYVWGLVSR